MLASVFRSALFGCCIALSSAVAIWIGMPFSSPVAVGVKDAKVTKARSDEKMGEAISPESMYFGVLAGRKSFGVLYKGPKRIRVDFVGFSGDALLNIYKVAKIADPQVFLVRGNDIQTAIQAASRHFNATGKVDVPFSSSKEAKDREFWLLVYFGQARSEPPPWTITSAVKGEGFVKVAFEPPPKLPKGFVRRVTLDLIHHLHWIPLGGLSPGRYTLQVIDMTSGDVYMSRKMLVSED